MGNKFEETETIVGALEFTAANSDSPASAEYYAERSEVVKHLKERVGDSEFILGLSGHELVRFISWCSSYRPVEPVSLLCKISACAGMLRQEIGGE